MSRLLLILEHVSMVRIISFWGQGRRPKCSCLALICYSTKALCGLVTPIYQWSSKCIFWHYKRFLFLPTNGGNWRMNYAFDLYPKHKVTFLLVFNVLSSIHISNCIRQYFLPHWAVGNFGKGAKVMLSRMSSWAVPFWNMI